MYLTKVSILSEQGIYPKATVLCGEVGYAKLYGIPLCFSVSNKQIIKPYRCPKMTLLNAAFLFTNRQFPLYHFHKGSNGYIFISSENKPNLTQVLERVKLILNGKIRLPILYDTCITPYEYRTLTMKKEPEYIDLLHCKQTSLQQRLYEIKNMYTFGKRKCSSVMVKKHYNDFLKSSRLIHVAIHYYTNAANLTNDNYTEDAGINLYLAVEAIIKDYMVLESIKDKAKAVRLLLTKIWPPDWGTDYLIDLWQARNEFLAHIDDKMFSKEERSNDSDLYCSDTFESVSWLITKYIEYQRKIVLA